MDVFVSRLTPAWCAASQYHQQRSFGFGHKCRGAVVIYDRLIRILLQTTLTDREVICRRGE
ncbi:hypothetical protein KCP73_06250 [Salmonella enterica subsp. enterica]|nr:hypothetical protein KCP73_06250 [Salmonella enterica subsp. enterica]